MHMVLIKRSDRKGMNFCHGIWDLERTSRIGWVSMSHHWDREIPKSIDQRGVCLSSERVITHIWTCFVRKMIATWTGPSSWVAVAFLRDLWRWHRSFSNVLGRTCEHLDLNPSDIACIRRKFETWTGGCWSNRKVLLWKGESPSTNTDNVAKTWRGQGTDINRSVFGCVHSRKTKIFLCSTFCQMRARSNIPSSPLRTFVMSPALSKHNSWSWNECMWCRVHALSWHQEIDK
jgi:hypothetical protein